MDTYQGDKSIRGYTPPTMADFEKAIEELRASLPEECFSTDREELVSHGSSTWTYHNPEILPGAVLYPRHTEDVVAMTKAAYKYGIPMVAVSGGSTRHIRERSRFSHTDHDLQRVSKATLTRHRTRKRRRRPKRLTKYRWISSSLDHPSLLTLEQI